MIAKRRRRKGPNLVRVTHANGTVEFKHPHSFWKPKTRRQVLAFHRRSDHWKRLRRKAIARDGGCARCGTSDGHLEVHHLTYARLGAERLSDVLTLCQPCHAAEHRERA